MDQDLRRFLADLHGRGRDHDAHERDRLKRLRNVEPDTAALLAVLVRAARPRRMLELGTSNGYSTVWLADGARAVDALLVSVDIDPQRTEQARANLAAAGLDDRVELLTDDAARVLAGASAGEWDLIFL
ncbi:MAG TPA: class I SAM-dependent methyltransferase, partial [Solirubrobacteraceae bacterium]